MQGGKETKLSVGTLDGIILFTPSYSMQLVFLYLQVKGVPLQILSDGCRPLLDHAI